MCDMPHSANVHHVSGPEPSVPRLHLPSAVGLSFALGAVKCPVKRKQGKDWQGKLSDDAVLCTANRIKMETDPKELRLIFRRA
jgi:hypothetical protein